PDHDRPLAGRGMRAAPVMGRWLREAGLVPGQVLCSTARRARETWQFAQPGLAATPPAPLDPRIYHPPAADLPALVPPVPPRPGGAAAVPLRRQDLPRRGRGSAGPDP